MAERGESSDQDIGFKAIQLFKEQSLGIGGYGAVCKAKCDDLLCAAKILHPTLFDPIAHQQVARRREHRLPIKRFEQECEFMSAIRHPNIVQYLCTFQDPDTGLPVLLMELMDDSLTHFLESSTQPIPYHIQVNICHDITLALSFLHSNNIVHRDLSGNNVLLIGNIRAKVTDFGMARLGDINPQATRLTFTMCPGTDVYMPPEAVRAQSVYTEKADCFSFGVVVVQILSRQFPKPGDRLKTVRMNDPQFPGGIIEVRVSEVERRHNHISQIDNDQPLMLIANNCLKDDDNERPSAQQLLERVVVLEESLEYIKSARPVQEILSEKDVQIREALEQIRTLNSDVEIKEQELRVREQDIEIKNVTIAILKKEKIELQQHMESQRKQYNVAIEQKNKTIERVKAEKEEAIEAIEARKQNLQTKFENEQQVHIKRIAERDQIIADRKGQISEKEKLNHDLQGVMRAKEERYHTELILQQERHVQEIIKQTETIAARENEVQKLHENMKRECDQFQQENEKCQQESKRIQQESERVQQAIKEKFQQELQKKKEEIEVLQEVARAESVKLEQEIEKKRKEIEVLRETIRNDNVKFQQELLHCQQQHYEEIKEKNLLMTATKGSQHPLLRGKLEFILSQCCRATIHSFYFLVPCSF
jgi:serine/threonine protein kinase